MPSLHLFTFLMFFLLSLVELEAVAEAAEASNSITAEGTSPLFHLSG